VVSEIGLDGRLAALQLLPSARLQPAEAAAAQPTDAAAAAAATDAATDAAGGAGGGAAGAATSARDARAAAPVAAEPAAPCPSDDPSAALAAFAAAVSAADVDALRLWLAACAAAFPPAGAAGGEGAEQEAKREPVPPPLLLSATGDKQLRTRLHGLVRQHLRWAESDVAAEGGEAGPKSIRLRCAYRGPNRGRGGAGKRARPDAPDRPKPRKVPGVIQLTSGGPPSNDAVFESLPPYLSFVVIKENVDTACSLAAIASMLRVPPRSLGYAGTKDKRGVTAQRVTLKRGDVSVLSGLNARLMGVRVGAAERVSAPLGLGMLRGNHFALTLRDVRGVAPADVAAALGALRSRGFVNYFGLQRFGAGAPGSRTHSVGAALLRGAWPEAADRLIGLPRPSDRPEVAAARVAWAERRDAKAALTGFPSSAHAEIAVLRRFAAPNWDQRNFVGALTAIPKTMRLMFVHAYQVRLPCSFVCSLNPGKDLKLRFFASAELPVEPRGGRARGALRPRGCRGGRPGLRGLGV